MMNQTTNPQSIIVYGEQGCGKTKHAKQIAAHFGIQHILDDLDRKSICCLDHNHLNDCLILTSDDSVLEGVVGFSVLQFDDLILDDDFASKLILNEPPIPTRNNIAGVHLGNIMIAGKTLTDAAFGLAYQSGWWNDLQTGEDLRGKRNVPELLCLIHSEVSEAMEGHRKNLMDDKLPHRKMVEVELADAAIRIFDMAGGMGYDLAGAIAEKLVYNASRADHKPENRKLADGKKF